MSSSNFKKRESETAFRVRQPSEQILRTKIKLLEGQVETLQSGINVFAQLKQKAPLQRVSETPLKCQHHKVIDDLRAKISRLQNKNRTLLQDIKTLENKLEDSTKQITRLDTLVIKLEGKNKELVQQNKELIKQNKAKNDKIFTLELQIRYLGQQHSQLKREFQHTKDQLEDLRCRVESVQNHAMIEISLKVPLVILKSEDYRRMREEIFSLKKRVNELELQKQWVSEDREFSKRREIVMDRYERSNIGEEIVRLKRNIDRGIGDGDDSSRHCEAFLSKYKEVQKTLKEMSK